MHFSVMCFNTFDSFPIQANLGKPFVQKQENRNSLAFDLKTQILAEFKYNFCIDGDYLPVKAIRLSMDWY